MPISAEALRKARLWVCVPLRIATFCWPFVTEGLALIWWIRSIDPMTLLSSTLLVVSLGGLSLLPNRYLYSLAGICCAGIVFLTAGVTIVHTFYVEQLWSEIPEMTIVDFGFGVVWLIVLGVLREGKAPGQN